MLFSFCFCNSSETFSSNETLNKSVAIKLKENRTKPKSYSEPCYLKHQNGMSQLKLSVLKAGVPYSWCQMRKFDKEENTVM